MNEEKSIPEQLKCNKSFFTVTEASKKTKLHRNTISNMIHDGRITPTLIGKRNMIHVSELNRLTFGETCEDKNIKLDLEIALKMSELEGLLHKRMSLGKNDFIEQLKMLSKGN